MYLGLCENPGGWGANPASKEKSKLRSLPWQPRLSGRSLGCGCGMSVCERTRSARCTASECKDASGCKDDTRLAARAAARPSAPQEAMACFKIKQVLGVS